MGLMEINWSPNRRQLRGFGVICVVAFAALGAWVFFNGSIFTITVSGRTGAHLGYVLWGLAAMCGCLSMSAPATLRPLYVGLTAVSLPIGYVVSHVVMAILFFGILTPIGLVFRLMGRDPLCRRFDPDSQTCWTPQSPVTDVKRYYRQF